MANNCQMMCVIKTESMLWSLWSHPSSGELISYVNESPNKRSRYPIHTHASRSCLHAKSAHIHCTHQTPEPPPSLTPLSIKKIKKMSRTACACEESLRWRGGGEPSNTAWLTQCNQSPSVQRTETQGGRNTAPTWIVSRHEWVGGFYCEQFSLGSPANDLKSILEKMIHANTLRPVIMCHRTAKWLFHPCVNCNIESRNAKQV